MKNIVYDLFTGYIKGIDREPLVAEFSIDLPFPINLFKVVEEKTGNMVQKVNDDGELLFKDDVMVDEITGEESWVEVTNSCKVTGYETVTNTYRVVVGEEVGEEVDEFGEIVEVVLPIYQEITTTGEIPIEWEDLEPVMFDEVVNKTYSLEQNPFLFTKDEVLLAKEQSIIDAQNAPPTEVEILQEDNASLWYENMTLATKVETNESEVASLWYELMQGGM